MEIDHLRDEGVERKSMKLILHRFIQSEDVNWFRGQKLAFCYGDESSCPRTTANFSPGLIIINCLILLAVPNLAPTDGIIFILY
jgi:hypothetical protein